MPFRTHLAAKPDEIILHDVAVNDPIKQDGCYKPVGFWYEVDGDWRRWCEAEGFGCAEYLHQVFLGDCNILVIDSLAKLDKFHNQYCVSGRFKYIEGINWVEVSEMYDGVEISPYQWKRRLAINFTWYYGWDCASGVIWRPKNTIVKYIGKYSKEEHASTVQETKSEEG